jgi:hypothetical protein
MSIKKKVFDIRNTIGKLQKKQENPFYNSAYFDISDLLDELQPHLEASKVLLTQPVRGKDVYSILECIETGEVMESYITIEGLTEPQKVGAAISYYRRYGLKSLLGISEEDDDANKTVKKQEDDNKKWLDETDKKAWMNAEEAVKSGKIKPRELRNHYKVSKLNMEYFESLIK